MKNKFIILGGVVLLAVLFFMGLVGGNQSALLGGMTNFDGLTIIPVESTDGLQVGSSGTLLPRINTGICYIKPYATTISATSTATVDCQGTAAQSASGISALAGVSQFDRVVANLSTTTAGTVLAGLNISGASASSTAGYITLRITNLTGTTYTWPTTGTASGTAFYAVFDNVSDSL